MLTSASEEELGILGVTSEDGSWEASGIINREAGGWNGGALAPDAVGIGIAAALTGVVGSALVGGLALEWLGEALLDGHILNWLERVASSSLLALEVLADVAKQVRRDLVVEL